MKNSLLFVVITLATFQLSAQQEIHLSVNSGIGKIGYNLYNGDHAYALRLEDKYSATFGINLGYTYRFGDFSIESGICYNDLKGKQKDGINKTEILSDGSTEIVKKDISIERGARYLSFPLKLNYRIDKLQIGVGVYLSTLISNRYHDVQYSDDEFTSSSYNDIESNGLSNLDFGLSGQIEYALSDRASLLFSTNYGLININPNVYFSGPLLVEEAAPRQRELKNIQLMVGLKFRLFKT